MGVYSVAFGVSDSHGSPAAILFRYSTLFDLGGLQQCWGDSHGQMVDISPCPQFHDGVSFSEADRHLSRSQVIPHDKFITLTSTLSPLTSFLQFAAIAMWPGSLSSFDPLHKFRSISSVMGSR